MSFSISAKVKELETQKEMHDLQITAIRNKYEREIQCLSSVHQKELIGIEKHTESVILEFEANLENIIKQKDTQIQSLKLDLQSLKESKYLLELFN